MCFVSAGLVVGLILLVALLCLLVLYFRKPANCKHFRSRVTSLFGVRHNAQFHYSRVSTSSHVRDGNHSCPLLTCLFISEVLLLFFGIVPTLWGLPCYINASKLQCFLSKKFFFQQTSEKELLKEVMVKVKFTLH